LSRRSGPTTSTKPPSSSTALEAIQRDREAQEAQLQEIQAQGKTLLREQVLEADIAEIVARWTGIPINRLLESERQKLLRLEGHLHERVIGQDEAVSGRGCRHPSGPGGHERPRSPPGVLSIYGANRGG
jgi:ATP-dependent Clp protease ATP-binding subunit ClpB